jgi:hypothetical protein
LKKCKWHFGTVLSDSQKDLIGAGCEASTLH